ncbi:alpha/beta fold hydrolase [Streptomyces sp. NPDC086777]|uniref:alpha/beta fold hydrolase n=1 Tax=Streptomyces sp. NPDC086777 TaxID=3154866 RepID=UPI00344FD230
MTNFPDRRLTFLLVHGAWHQSSCWAPLQAALAENGWRSGTVDLPSSGDQSTPNAGMYDDAVAIEEALQRVADVALLAWVLPADTMCVV